MEAPGQLLSLSSPKSGHGEGGICITQFTSPSRPAQMLFCALVKANLNQSFV